MQAAGTLTHTQIEVEEGLKAQMFERDLMAPFHRPVGGDEIRLQLGNEPHSDQRGGD
jgi:hypothetical protein